MNTIVSRLAEGRLLVACPSCDSSFEISIGAYEDAARLSQDLKCSACRGVPAAAKSAGPVFSGLSSQKGRRPGPTRPTSVMQVVLLAVDRLTAGVPGSSGAHRSWIVVEAWTADKARLGLKGYESLYPDSNRITVELVRASSLAAGLLERTGENQFALTTAGLAVVKAAKKRLKAA